MSKSPYTPPPEVIRASVSTAGYLFGVTAQQNPDKTALIEGNTFLTYKELNNRVNQLANLFLSQKICRGDRIALLARNCISFIEVELAAAKVGAITVSFNWRWTKNEIEHCLELTTPKLIVAGQEFKPVLASVNRKPNLVFSESYEEAIKNQPKSEPNRPIDSEDGLVIIFTMD